MSAGDVSEARVDTSGCRFGAVAVVCLLAGLLGACIASERVPAEPDTGAVGDTVGGDVVVRCSTAAACDDSDPCTLDRCGESGVCVWTAVPGCVACDSVADCPAAGECEEATCDGRCGVRRLSGCLACDDVGACDTATPARPRRATSPARTRRTTATTTTSARPIAATPPSAASTTSSATGRPSTSATTRPSRRGAPSRARAASRDPPPRPSPRRSTTATGAPSRRSRSTPSAPSR